MPNRWIKCVGSFSVVALPFHYQKSVLRLSVLLRTVHSRMSKVWARASRCNKPPASSRSEFEMILEGFSVLLSWSTIYWGHFNLYITSLLSNPTLALNEVPETIPLWLPNLIHRGVPLQKRGEEQALHFVLDNWLCLSISSRNHQGRGEHPCVGQLNHLV